ncbi:hypothetical protein HMPREF9135_0574 [Segatella baroniae F0067]|uniref:Protein FecR C-terminal domain-containing protein n=1 Tax=Segatella baroniae F0067 TaxID=1115809 RepID=U2QG26_9BACT|nr:DUF4974 domain-containing protein [Segatella baroniae]ERK40278.1 hypothetical protein HMPREF9135_0574 [Segatella baroniae F0067]
MDSKKPSIRLLKAIEYPELFSEQELDALLRDDEAREYYRLMADAAAAGRYARQRELPDDVLDREWRRLVEGRRPALRRRYRVAAAVAVVLLVSGLALAAIHIVRTNRAARQEKTAAVAAPSYTSRGVETAFPVDTAASRTLPAAADFRQFDNERLVDIVREMAAYYHVRVVCLREESGDLRLRYRWDRSLPVEKVVASLNMFHHVDLTLDHAVITIR